MTDPVNKVLGHKHSPDTEARQKRHAVRTVPCPFCGVGSGVLCVGVRGQRRYASHQERWDLYRKENK